MVVVNVFGKKGTNSRMLVQVVIHRVLLFCLQCSAYSLGSRPFLVHVSLVDRTQLASTLLSKLN